MPLDKEGCHLCCLQTSRHAALLLLLQVEESVPSNSAPASFAGRVVKVLREGPLGRLLPQEEATSPMSVVLAAVAGATLHFLLFIGQGEVTSPTAVVPAAMELLRPAVVFGELLACCCWRSSTG